MRPGDPAPSASPPAALLADLRLDEIVARLSGGRSNPQWAALIATPLPDGDAVAYRQEVFRDVQTAGVAAALRTFVTGIATSKGDADRASGTRHPLERDRWSLAAMSRYVDAVAGLLAGLEAAPLTSRALVACRHDLREYAATAAFAALRDDTRDAVDALGAVRYRLRIGEHRVSVGTAADEPDYLTELREALSRFRSSDSVPVEADRFDTIDLNPVEAQILDRVARLAPSPFAAMAAAVRRHRSFAAESVGRLAGEAAFYVGWLDMLAPLATAGLHWSLPAVAAVAGGVGIQGGFDLALALDPAHRPDGVVGNDVEIGPDERVAVITGANRSGKTAFARAIGQIHLLAAVGCPVPARAASVPLVDAVHVQADRAEGLADPGGRLELDLRQMVGILDTLTDRGLVILNEAFGSTTVTDALELSRKVFAEIRNRGARVLAVTFLHELAGDPATVSIVCGTSDRDPEPRPFAVTRRPAEGLAHAQAVGVKYGLTHDQVQAQVTR